jgi:hypothetical protein
MAGNAWQIIWCALAFAAVPPAWAQSPPPHQGSPASALAEGQDSAAQRWCVDYRRGQLSGEARLDGFNLRRLEAAEAELAPMFSPGRSKDGLRLVADYQEELGRPAPDRTVAATYLALLSGRPVTMELVRRTNALLCVSVHRAFAEALVSEAELLRREMSR